MNNTLIDVRDIRGIDEGVKLAVILEVQKFLKSKYFQDIRDWNWDVWPILGISRDNNIVGYGSDYNDPDRDVITFREMRHIVLAEDSDYIKLQKQLNPAMEYSEELV